MVAKLFNTGFEDTFYHTLHFFFNVKILYSFFVKTSCDTKLLAHPADTQATDACSAVEAFSSMFEK